MKSFRWHLFRACLSGHRLAPPRAIAVSILLGIATCLSVRAQASDYYSYEVIARVNGSDSIGRQITGLGAPSINDSGQVAFTGFVAQGSVVYVVDQTGLPIPISGTTASSTQNYGGFVQINNAGQVLSRNSSTSTSSFIRRWVGVSQPGANEVIANAQPGETVLRQFESVLTHGTINNSGQVAYSAFGGHGGPLSILCPNTTASDGCLATPRALPPDRFNVNATPMRFPLRPMMADDGRIVVRTGNLATDPIVLYSYDLTTSEVIAGPSDYSQLGQSPGISDDSQIVVFYGIKIGGTDPGPGIFASIRVSVGRVIERIAGIAGNGRLDPGESFTDLNGNNVFDSGIDTEIGLSSFVADSRVSVNSTQASQRGVTIVFQAVNTSGQTGIYSTRLSLYGDGFGPFNVADPEAFTIDYIKPVVVQGDTITGLTGTVQQTSIFDPLNSRDRGEVAFSVGTTGGDIAIIRARSQEVVFLDFDAATTYRPEMFAARLFSSYNFTTISPFVGGIGTVFQALAPQRADLNSPTSLQAIQAAVITRVQETFDSISPTVTSGVAVRVLGRPGETPPTLGPYMRVYIGDGPHSASNPDGTAGVTYADIFNQNAQSFGSGTYFTVRETPLIFVDNIFRIADFTGSLTGGPDGILDGNFTSQSGPSSTLVDLSVQTGPSAITPDQVAFAIAHTISHEVGHSLGLMHLTDARDDLVMNAYPSTPLSSATATLDEMRNLQIFGSSPVQLNTAQSFPIGSLENSGARLAFAAGSSLPSTGSGSIARDPPNADVLAKKNRIAYRMTSSGLAAVNVTRATVILIRKDGRDVEPEFYDLGSGQLGALLNAEILVQPGDRLVLLASTQGTGVDVFGVVAGASSSQLASIDLSSPWSAMLDRRLQAELFDSQGSPRPAPISVYQRIGSSHQLIGSAGSADATNLVNVPNVVGLTQAAAITVITNSGLTVGTVTQESSSTVPAGSVIGQNPAGGASVTAGSAVSLVVSSGPAQVIVPNVVGLSQPAAALAITNTGLALGDVTQQVSSSVPAGNVISQNPTGGTSVVAGSAVDLVVSSGPAQVSVPNVVGVTQTAATIAITDAGLVLGTVTQQVSSAVPAGSVISQNPTGGTSVAVGSAVNLVVSSGPAQVNVPNVVGATQSAATTAIINAGLVLGTVTRQSSSTVPAGSVISQNPVSGATVAVGSAVNLVISTGPAPVNVPNVVGLSQAAATTAITSAGLALGTVTQQSSSSVPAGNVISQNPTGGTSVAVGSAVNLVISTGPAPVSVPNVVGLSQAAATLSITNAGLVLGTITQQSSSSVTAGNVISQSPTGGTSVAAGSAVNLVVSTGPAQVTVPNVIGQPQAAAITAITNAGLVVGTVTQQSNSTVPAGDVISQNPTGGVSVVVGSAVSLMISSGPAPVLVPNVVGQTQAAATTTITNAGLVVGTVRQEASSSVAAGNVISQNPTGGTSVSPGSAVNLVVSSGPALLSVPNVVGLTQSTAVAALTNAGLVLGTVTQQSSSTVPPGNVISQSPSSGTSVAVGSAVNLVISSGPAQVSVPNVVGATQSEAVTAITNAGLVLGAVTQQSSSTVVAGRVISQNPASGTNVNIGSAVSLVVSTGPAPVSVPNVVGMTQSAAATVIINMGLVLGTVNQQASSTVPAGSVISQNPTSGTSVAVGSAVNLIVSSGPAQVSVPNVVGLPQSAAATSISNAGLSLGSITQQSSATVIAGNVISQNPTSGTSVTFGSAVSLVISSGPPAPLACDINSDRRVDRDDIALITAARNQPASGPNDPRDADRNGVINVLDARQCTALCTFAQCAAQ